MSTNTDPIWETETGESFTEEIEPGTASDPDVTSETEATITVDGTEMTLEAGTTILDALDGIETAGYVPALCSYGEEELIGPRSACRTCIVETEEHGLIPACSHPPADGMTVRTDSQRATEARDLNLDLQLSDHNLRCTTCGKNGRCELQDVSIENEVEEPRYGVFDDRTEYEPIDDSSPFIQIDRNKCILCNRCVEACNDVQVEGVLRMEGSADETRIGFQNGTDTMMESTCVSCGHCATVCPTGSLVEQGMTESATIPIPGFTQKESVGSTVGEEYERQPHRMTPMKRAEQTETGGD